jgi:hypothetical protein
MTGRRSFRLVLLGRRRGLHGEHEIGGHVPKRKARVVSEQVEIETPKDREDEYRVRRGTVRFLTVPQHRFVMVDGFGPAGGEPFEARMPGLYATAYGLRFALKRRGVIAKVGPLEGLWWHAEGATDLDEILAGDRADWRWTLMIVLPDEATDDEIEEQLTVAGTKVEADVALTLRVERFKEGGVAQVLHVGPYSEERPSIERLHAGIAEADFHHRGRHHELYLGDPRRSAPERLRTILRHPVDQWQ